MDWKPVNKSRPYLSKAMLDALAAVERNGGELLHDGVKRLDRWYLPVEARKNRYDPAIERVTLKGLERRGYIKFVGSHKVVMTMKKVLHDDRVSPGEAALDRI